MLSVVDLNDILLSAIRLSVVTLSVVILSAIRLSIVRMSAIRLIVVNPSDGIMSIKPSFFTLSVAVVSVVCAQCGYAVCHCADYQGVLTEGTG